MELVSEAAIGDAMRFARRELGVTIEGSAAVVLAWLREHPREEPAPIVALLTGSDVDPAVLARIAGHA